MLAAKACGRVEPNFDVIDPVLEFVVSLGPHRSMQPNLVLVDCFVGDRPETSANVKRGKDIPTDVSVVAEVAPAHEDANLKHQAL